MGIIVVLLVWGHAASTGMRRASPSSYIDRDSPPILLVHGAKDTVVFIDSTDGFYNHMVSAGAEIEYRRFSDGTHRVMGQKARITTPAMNKFFEKHLGIRAKR